jgi:hypothetical protein
LNSGRLPKDPYVRDKVLKHFMAKSFRFTPQQCDEMDFEDFEALVYLESLSNEKERKEQEKLRHKK